MTENKPEEFPQMLTTKYRDARGVVRTVAVVKDGRPVVFQNARELKDYDGKGVAHTAPEQHSHPNYCYAYDPFQTS